jgi:hypothetical protein
MKIWVRTSQGASLCCPCDHHQGTIVEPIASQLRFIGDDLPDRTLPLALGTTLAARPVGRRRMPS